MNLRPSCQKKITSTIIVFILCTLTLSVHCQSQDSIDAKWANLLQQYKTRKINATQYLQTVDTMVDADMGDMHLKEKLATYKELIWQTDSLKKRRYDYYQLLVVNARSHEETGKVIYYIEKMAKDLGRPYPTLGINVEKMSFYSASGEFDKSYEAYMQARPVLIKKINAIVTDSTRKVSAWSTLANLEVGLGALMKRNDTAKIEELKTIAESVYSNILKNKKVYNRDSIQAYEFLLTVRADYYFFYKKFAACERAYKEALSLCDLPVNKIGSDNRYAVLQALTGFYIHQKNKDSATRYLQLELEQMIALGDFAGFKDKIKYHKQKSEIQVLAGNFSGAYQSMLDVQAATDSLLNKKTVEINENMFAQSVAEDSREEIDKTNKQKELLTIQNQWIIFGSILTAILLTVIIVILYRQNKQKEKKAKEKIDSLNQSTALQIAELEERNTLMQKIEQKRLGQELHDELAGTLTALKMQLSLESMNTTDKRLKDKLDFFIAQTTQAYEYTRNKSHEWYMPGIDITSFSFRIKTILENVLPSALFKKEINIDDDALQTIDLPTKINILKIIQEAVTNVIKHADARKVSVTIKHSPVGVLLTIADDGKGFNTETKNKISGIGFQSIEERAKDMGGNLELLSGKNGTQLSIQIPMARTEQPIESI